MTKRNLEMAIYILFGVAIQQLVHHLAERWYIDRLIEDFERYGFGWSWDTWFLIHHVMSLVLLVIGIWLGYELYKFRNSFKSR